MLCEPHRSSRHQITFAESRRRVLWLGQLRRREYGINRRWGAISKLLGAVLKKHARRGSHAKNQRQIALARTAKKTVKYRAGGSVSGDALRRKDRGRREK